MNDCVIYKKCAMIVIHTFPLHDQSGTIQEFCLYPYQTIVHLCLLVILLYDHILDQNIVLSQPPFLHHDLSLCQDHHPLRRESQRQRSICP